MEIIISIIVIFVTLWMNLLASISLMHDDILEPFQRTAQFILIWLVPLIGASLILHLVFEHSPNAIPKKWIPWPFKGVVFGKSHMINQDRDENELDYTRSNRTEFNKDSESVGNDSGD